MYGSHVHEAVVESGVSHSAICIHLVDEHYDQGPVVHRREVPVMPSDAVAMLQERIVALEPTVYVEALGPRRDGHHRPRCRRGGDGGWLSRRRSAQPTDAPTGRSARMIVVAEGPSAAGKTTWVQRHHPDVAVPEHPSGADCDTAADAAEAARFWAEANARRWHQAEDLEQRHGIAVCDSDPCKLHYAWCTWQVGHTDRSAWEAAADATRDRFATEELGLADLIVVQSPSLATLQTRQAHDRTRMRRNFALHVRLAEPLVEWYRAVDAIDPGRVRWAFPSQPIEPGTVPPRTPRSGVELFDRLLEALPHR